MPPSRKRTNYLRRLAAARVILQDALRGGRILRQLLLRPHGPLHQLTAAVRAAPARQAVGGAVRAEGALERANQGIRGLGRQILVAAFAIGAKGEHASSLLAPNSRGHAAAQ